MIADDHTLVREGIRSLLAKLPDVEVIGEANDGLEAVNLCKHKYPDVVLMDIGMPGLNGLDATTRIAMVSPSTRVLFLSMHANEEYMQQALQMGAAGYLLKGADLKELEFAIRSVGRGGRYLTPAVANYMVDGYRDQTRRGQNPLAKLTSRQREVLQLIAEGYSTKDIAGRLGLSIKTVETHRAQVMKRLGIHDVAGLVRLAIRKGLIRTDH
jgi:DNA-binding NarL/FixJ family response regulator